ncbi:MAG: carbonic anhydrase [Alphaproteobacteria bacterium]|nr:carbonic anhydrase [Alphaproteobacteria bacterium]
MTPRERLIDGYRQFRNDAYASQVAAYRRLAAGQRPNSMIVACCDSRVDPATIFSAGPGELFVVRNVANLVPPFSNDTFHHGTSAALEFAVENLKVDQIVVMGHGDCGGIQACMEAGHGKPASYFVGPWVEIAAPARDEVLMTSHRDSEADQRRSLERAAILLSLENLKTFPFVREAMKTRGLRLEGAWFSVAEGALYWLDDESHEFRLIPAD